MSNTAEKAAAAETSSNDLVIVDEVPYQQYVYKDTSNDQDKTYTIRGLLNDDEIHQWSKFCESIFAYKSNPPSSSYFERHYYNDPNGPKYGPSLIRVAIDNDTQEIVASCRVFVRDLSKGRNTFGPEVVRAGGIGEVCTSDQHRKRGLSKVLLLDCIRLMKTNQLNLQVSLLHAAPTFFPVYEKAGGYQNTTSEWSSVQVSYNDEIVPTHIPDHEKYTVRVAQFPDDTEQLQTSHWTYSVRSCPGCIIRSEEYWNTYISKELENSLFVLTYDNEYIGKFLVAWLSIRQRGENTYQVREFGCYRYVEDGKVVLETDLAMEYLFPHAMHHLLHTPEQKESSSATCTLILPTFVLEEMKKGSVTSFSNNNKKQKLNENESSSQQKQNQQRFNVDWSTVKTENDLGWMYLSLTDDDETNEWLDTILVDKKKTISRRPHLIWPSDSF